MEFQNTNLKVLVGNETTSAAETTLKTFKTSGTAGELTASNNAGGTIASASERFIVALKKATGKLDQTETVVISGIRNIEAAAYSAASERVEYVGFNGTSGAVEVINDFLYQINFKLFNYGSLSTENTYLRTATTKSTSTATQAAIVDGLLGSAIRNVSREPYRLKFEMILNDGGAAITGTGDLTVEKGSRFVSAATDADAVVAVGDYLRIDSTAPSGSVYRIVAIDAANDVIELSVPYQGDSATVAEASNEYVVAATAATSDAGLKITGVAQDFIAGKLKFQKVDWVTTTVDFDADLTLASAASIGVGEGARVAELEWFAVGNFGEHYRMGEPHLYPQDFEAVVSGKYDTLVIDWAYEQDAFVGTKSPRQLLIFASAGAAGTDHTAINGLITKLNAASGLNIATL
jgi:hypothetical protein